jgi:hypothetical protein
MNEMRKVLKKEIGAQAVVVFNKRPRIWSRFCLSFRKIVSSTRFSSKESLDILLHSCRGDHQNRTRLPGLQKASRRADQAQKRPIHLRDGGSTITVGGRCLLFGSLIIYSQILIFSSTLSFKLVPWSIVPPYRDSRDQLNHGRNLPFDLAKVAMVGNIYAISGY